MLSNLRKHLSQAGLSALFLAFAFTAYPQSQDSVRVVVEGGDVAVSVGGKLFTRYTTKSGPNKPFFYPILNDAGSHFTRRWPVEPDAAPGESHDHPHHRGLWFTHSKVNGIDFWSEQGRYGRTVTLGYSRVHSGRGTGGFTAKTEWRTPDDRVIATDTRVITISALPNGGRYLDFDITIKPAGGPLVFGDNKDGVFGLRLPDSLAVNPDVKPRIPGTGHILTSTGMKDGEAWGKRADWVDYWGPIGGATYGVAIFDSPNNLRHPQTWHARDYALFTVNPFGLHDFGLGDKGAGDYTVPQGGSLHLLYRVYFHKGDSQQAGVAERYAQFAKRISGSASGE